MPLTDPATGAAYLMPSDEIDRAVAAERERCAKIAEGFGVLDGVKAEPVYRAKTIGEAIAKVIRNKE